MDDKKIATDTLTGLDYLLKLRITVSSITLAVGITVFALSLKTSQVLENDRKHVSGTAPGTKLDSKALLNLTRISIVICASFIIKTFFLTVFLARRWHHPNPSKPKSFLQRTRTIIKLVMECQSFVVCVVFSFMLTLVSNANTQFEPATINLPDGRLRLGIPTRYIENRYVMALVGTAWVMSFGYLLGFILEVWVISRHRRFQQVVFIEN